MQVSLLAPFPKPYTLYPIPYTLYPIPYTLYPIPYTLYPITPESFNCTAILTLLGETSCVAWMKTNTNSDSLIFPVIEKFVKTPTRATRCAKSNFFGFPPESRSPLHSHVVHQ